MDRSLKTDTSRRLAELLAKSGCIEILELSRGLEIRTTSFVGRLKFDDLTITIQPKLPGAPLLNLFRYAYQLRDLSVFDEVGYQSERWTFQDLVIVQLAAEVSELLARGIHREYEQIHDELASPRGRIDFQRLVKMRPNSSVALPCVHHPRTENTVLNQVVLSGLAFAVQLATSINLRARLNRLVKTMSPTVSIIRLTAESLRDARSAIDRRTRKYAPALSLIEILFRAEGISLEGKSEQIWLPGFLFDMNRFFQSLLSRFLHDHLDNHEVCDEVQLRELFSYDPKYNPKKRRAPVQKPDFIIRRNQQIEAILDAKYRDLWENSLPREMLYQLALYALGQPRSESKSVILYPTTSAGASEQVIQLSEPTGGVLQARVVLRPVSLIEMEKLLRNNEWKSNKARVSLAHKLAFGANVSLAGAATSTP